VCSIVDQSPDHIQHGNSNHDPAPQARNDAMTLRTPSMVERRSHGSGRPECGGGALHPSTVSQRHMGDFRRTSDATSKPAGQRGSPAHVGVADLPPAALG
jgi:hypothetical protein